MSSLTADVFLTRPATVEIAVNARAQWDKYAAQRGDAQEAAIDAHVEHVRKMMVFGLNPEIGAVLITDIANTNLSVVDAHFPATGERVVTVFTRRGAAMIIHLFNRAKHGVD